MGEREGGESVRGRERVEIDREREGQGVCVRVRERRGERMIHIFKYITNTIYK